MAVSVGVAGGVPKGQAHASSARVSVIDVSRPAFEDFRENAFLACRDHERDAVDGAYLTASHLVSDLPALSITLWMNSYCAWTNRSAISRAESTISCRLDGPSPCGSAGNV